MLFFPNQRIVLITFHKTNVFTTIYLANYIKDDMYIIFLFNQVNSEVLKLFINQSIKVVLF